MVLHFDRQNIDVRHVMFNIGESDVRITGSIAHWLAAPRGKLVVQSSQVDLQSFQSREKHRHPLGSDSPPDLTVGQGQGRGDSVG